MSKIPHFSDAKFHRPQLENKNARDRQNANVAVDGSSQLTLEEDLVHAATNGDDRVDLQDNRNCEPGGVGQGNTNGSHP